MRHAKLSGGGAAKKLAGTLTRLGKEAESVFYPGKSGVQKQFTTRYFYTLVERWLDWKRGIPPSREYRGRGGQNPRLLDCFAALDGAETRVKTRLQAEHEREMKRLQQQGRH